MNLSKLNILYTGLNIDNKTLAPLINSDKTNFIHFPTIEIEEAKLRNDDLNKIENANKYDYLIFTSINGVKYFLKKYNNDFSTLSCSTKVVAIGKKTASLLLNNNIDVDLIPPNSSSESIDELLTANLINGKSVLIPGSLLSKTDLVNSLESKGAMVDFIAIYENNIPKNISDNSLKAIEKKNIDLLVFTSPSTFYNFISIFKIENPQQYFANKKIATIGTVTKGAIEKENLHVDIVPQNFNLDSLTRAIKNYYKLT